MTRHVLMQIDFEQLAQHVGREISAALEAAG